MIDVLLVKINLVNFEYVLPNLINSVMKQPVTYFILFNTEKCSMNMKIFIMSILENSNRVNLACNDRKSMKLPENTVLLQM